ncbi:macrophage mannose receptor 1-like [Chanos chanos]|uniref:Macrophage mannose receptor 1-like n=1 Tax=Chanos chanos TaxID=29144 RepID=A0A6J2VF64_CHACN|nr:macrophage mannose receptor 1-like [Chanos chanos]
MKTVTAVIVLLAQISHCFPNSENFQIYNAKSNRCLSEKLESLVTCNTDSLGQKFRWTSEGRIFNIHLKICLGVGSKTEGSKLQWYICDGTSNLQKWECQRDKLFGLKNESLFMSVNERGFIWLSRQDTGEKSEWTIYGTKDSICSKTYEEIYTIGGTGFGQPCHFPFFFENKWYADCTTKGWHHLWCATERFYEPSQRWGHCPMPRCRCQVHWKTNPLTGIHYQINHRSALTWHQARKSCLQQGADLMSVVEPHEHTFVAGPTQPLDVKLWTGLNSLDLSSGWQWSNGQPFCYLKWAAGQPRSAPGEHCAALGKFGWQSEVCSKRLGYICQKGNTLPSVSPEVHKGYCSSPWIPYAGHCYFLYREQKKTWLEAKAACLKDDGDLLSILNIEEQDFVVSQFGFRLTDELWIGLNDRKSQLLFRWSDESDVTFTMWDLKEPSHGAGLKKDCVIIRGNEGKWADQDCDKVYGFICKKKAHSNPSTNDTVVSNPGCKLGWTRHGYYCYLAGSETETFDKAKQACQKTGSYLVDVPSRVENAFLVSLVGTRPEKYFWIGLSNQEDRYTFKWTNTDEVKFTHFNTGMPGQRQGCVAMTTGRLAGLWDVLSCTNKEKYICKYQAEGVTTTSAPPTSPAPACAEGWEPLINRDFCFKLYESYYSHEKTWFEALDYCRAVGGDLLSIHSPHDRPAQYHFQFDAAWIGFSAQDPNVGYVWSDGTSSAYENWAPEQPNNKNNMEYCVEVYLDPWKYWQWNDIHCESKKHLWVCEIRKEYNVTEDGWIEFKGNQYYFRDHPYVAMEDARAFCNQRRADLVVINDEEERIFLWQQLRNYRSDFYIGLTVDLDYSMQWMDGSPVVFQAWEENEPAFKNNDETCVKMTRSQGVWESCKCGEKYYFICKRSEAPHPHTTLAPTQAPKGGCGLGWMKFQGKCYKIELDQKTWGEARESCRDMGGNLISIVNEQQQAFLTTKLLGVHTALWIGFTARTSGRWLWTDGSAVKFTNWDLGEKGKFWGAHCAIMLSRRDSGMGKWKSRNCEETNGFICRRPLDHLIEPETTAIPQSFIKFGNDSFKLILTNHTWKEARQLCEKEGSHLASIRDHLAQAYIQLQTHKMNEPVWIGLNSIETDGYFRWIDNWHLNMAKWGPGEPKRDHPCVYVDVDGTWRTALCNQTYRSVCKISTDVAPTAPPQYPGQCPKAEEEDDMTWLPFRGHCYAFVNTEQTWSSASIQCKMWGASLLSIEDTMEDDFLKKNLEVYRDIFAFYWIGLYKTHRDQWLWLDDTVVDYTNWADGNPTDMKCAAVSSLTSQWHSEYCDEVRPFICKAARAPVPTPTVYHPDPVPAKVRQVHGSVVAVCIFAAVILAGGVGVLVYYRKSNGFVPPTFQNPLYFTSNNGNPDDINNDDNKLVDHTGINERLDCVPT